MLASKHKSQELLDEIGVFGRKDAPELKIHRWKLQAKSLENSDIVDSKRLLGIIAIYENDFNNANKYFDQALTLSNYKDYVVFNDYGQALLIQGKGIEAINHLVTGFSLEPHASTLDKILSQSKAMLYPEALPTVSKIIEKFDFHKQDFLELVHIHGEVISRITKFLDSINVSIESYRSIINISNITLHKKFYTQCLFGAYEYDSLLNVIIYPEGLTLDEVSELNDDFVEQVVEFGIPTDELLKLSVYFSFDSQKVMVDA